MTAGTRDQGCSIVTRFWPIVPMRPIQIVSACLALATSLVAFWLWMHPVREELRLFPERPAYLFSYDDRSSGGASVVRTLERLDDGMRFSFLLGPSRSAFAGAGADFSGPGRNRKGIDLSDFDAIELDLRVGSPLTLKVVLTGFDSAIWKEGDWLSRRYSEARIENPPDGKVRIPLDRFVLQSWWLDRGLVAPTDTARSFDQVQTFAIQAVAGRKAPDGKEDTILVRDLRAVRVHPRTGAWIWLVPVLLAIAGVPWRPLRPRRIPIPAPGVAPRPLEPVPLPLGNESDDLVGRLSEHLARNYPRPELDAATVCRETGIPRSRLSEIVKAGFGTAFKAHLNDLRLKEAARLLSNTDRGVAEIGFAVGYNSVAHFHRVFRERHGVPPGEYRSRAQKTGA